MAEHIRADLLIPGRGEPIERGVVVLDDRRVSYAGPADEAPPPTSVDRVTEVATVMPGLWDCHVHFVGTATPDVERMLTEHPVTAAGRAVADAAALVDGGVTSARDVGGLGLQLAPVFAEGRVVGPHVHAAGRILSTTGGHGDVHRFPLDCVHTMSEATGFSALCDGVPEVLRAVRMNLRSNAKLIKICASGGVMSEVDHPIHQQFSDEELSAIVAEAGRAERIVAAHCHGKPGIMAALRAGCHTIEHGSYLDEEAADAMVASGAMLVPTRFVIDNLLRHEDTMPPYAYTKLQMVAGEHEQAMKIAIAKGVRIAAGCDIFVSGATYGRAGEEIRLLHEAGLPILDAIEAATANGPETLGPQAPRSGQLQLGFDADVIALDASPLDDPSIFGVPEHVTHVWKAAELVKQPAT
ncbi:MAG: amidohydrolase family protein [Actinomycetota bacterium]